MNGNGAYGGRSHGDRGGDRQYGDRGGFGRDRDDRPKPQAMEVYVENNIEKAMKVLKRKLIKEGLFKELKSRRYYEKPSQKKKRKEKDSIKKARKEEARQKKNPFLFS
jgi:small subunit ribosomal protein S21